VPGEVFNGLSHEALALLEPCALTVLLSAEPLALAGEQQPAQQQRTRQQGVLEEEEGEQQGQADEQHAQQPVGQQQQAQQQAPPHLQLVAPPEPAQLAGDAPHHHHPHQHRPHSHQQHHQGQQQRDAKQQQQRQPSPYERFPALTVSLGQPLVVTLTVTNHGRTCSSSSGIDRSAGGGGDAGSPVPDAPPENLSLEAVLCCQPVRGTEQEEAAAAAVPANAQPGAELSAVWTGPLWTNLGLKVAPGQTAKQRLGLCLLAPGLYQIGLQHWRCSAAGGREQQGREQPEQQRAAGLPGPPPNTMVAVQPCYLLAQ
jgi:hypothetical protein